MPANDAASCSAKHAMTTGEVPHSPAYQCAFNASFGIDGRSYPDERKCHCDAPNHVPHRSLPLKRPDKFHSTLGEAETRGPIE
jgi:hypothetical protein